MDLNTAGERELAAVPGIGITVAKRIVQYRQKHGRITSFDELLDIPYFGEKKLAMVEKYCNISQSSFREIYDENAQLSNKFQRDATWPCEVGSKSDEEDQECQYRRRYVVGKLQRDRRLTDYYNQSPRQSYISTASIQESFPSYRRTHTSYDYTRNCLGENSSSSYNATKFGVPKQQSYPSHVEENHFYDQAPKIFSNLCRSHDKPLSHVSNPLTYPSYSQESRLYDPSLGIYITESQRASAKQENTSHYHSHGKYFNEISSTLTKQQSTLYDHAPKKCSNASPSTSIKEKSTAYYDTPKQYSNKSALIKQGNVSCYPTQEKYANQSISTSIKQENTSYYHTPGKHSKESPSTSIKQESISYYHTPDKFSTESPNASIKQESILHHHLPEKKYSNKSSSSSVKQENTSYYSTPGEKYSNKIPSASYNVPALVKRSQSSNASLLVSSKQDSPIFFNKQIHGSEKMLSKMPGKNSGKKETGRLNLNTASVEELKRIGITDVTSQKIVKYRENHKFESFDDLHFIPYMHKKTIEKLKQHCVIKEKADADLSLLVSSQFDELSQKMSKPKEQPLDFTSDDLARKWHKKTPTKDFTNTASTSVLVASELLTTVSHSKRKTQSSTKTSCKTNNINASKNTTNRLDLNTASVEELKQIGVTDVTAQKIVSYRAKNEFESFDDLYNINNMREQAIERLKLYCTIIQKKDAESLPLVFTPFNQLIPYKDICSYKSVKEFQSLEVGNALLMLHVNIRSLNANLPKLEELIEPLEHPCDIICVSDTYNPKFEEDVQLPSYTYHESQSIKIPRTRQGGVAIYLKENLKWCLREDLRFFKDKCENLWLEITSNMRKISLVIGAIYLHDFTKSFQAFQKELEKICKKLAKENKIVYIFGDININLLNEDGNTAKYCEFLYKLGLKILITKPTRETKTRQKGTLLDHIYTTDDQVQDVSSGIIKEDDTQVVSDHYPIYCVV